MFGYFAQSPRAALAAADTSTADVGLGVTDGVGDSVVGLELTELGLGLTDVADDVAAGVPDEQEANVRATTRHPRTATLFTP